MITRCRIKLSRIFNTAWRGPMYEIDGTHGVPENVGGDFVHLLCIHSTACNQLTEPTFSWLIFALNVIHVTFKICPMFKDY